MNSLRHTIEVVRALCAGGLLAAPALGCSPPAPPPCTPGQPLVGYQDAGCPTPTPTSGASCSASGSMCFYCGASAGAGCNTQCRCDPTDSGTADDGGATALAWSCTPSCPIGGPAVPPELA